MNTAYEFWLRNGSVLSASEQLELSVSYIDFIRNSWNKTEKIKEMKPGLGKLFIIRVDGELKK